MNLGFNNAIACIVITAGIILTTPARAAEEQYFSAQYAFSDVSTRPSLSNGTALVATYGKSLSQFHEYLGVEAEYTTSVKKPEYDTPANRAEFDYYTAALYGLMTFPVAEKVSLRARAGVLYENWKYRDSVLGNSSDKAVDFSIGGGAIYDINEYLNLIAEITIIESNILHASAGMQFKF